MTETTVPSDAVTDVKKIFSKRNTARCAVGVVAGTSTKFVIATAIARYVPTETKTQKVKLAVGSYAISSMVGAQASKYIRDEFDDWSELVTSAIEKVRKTSESAETSDPETDPANQ